MAGRRLASISRGSCSKAVSSSRSPSLFRCHAIRVPVAVSVGKCPQSRRPIFASNAKQTGDDKATTSAPKSYGTDLLNDIFIAVGDDTSKLDDRRK